MEKQEAGRYLVRTITDADYANDIALLVNTPDKAESLLHILEQAASGIGLHVNADKTEYMCFNQSGDISTLNGETSGQVHLHRKQHLIYWKWHQYATSEGMDSYRQSTGHMEVRSIS